MQPIALLQSLISSPVGQAVLSVMALCSVYAFFAAAKAALKLFQNYARTTPNKIDDKLGELAEDALEAAENRAERRFDPKQK